MGESDDGSGFEEAQAGFQISPSLDVYLAIYRQVLAAYDYRCALTGERFEAVASGLHPQLDVVAIHAREAGGPLHVGNYLPLSADAAQAFKSGQIVIGDDFAIIADHRVLDPALAARLSADGHLILPKDALYYPDRRQLAHHRNAVLRG